MNTLLIALPCLFLDTSAHAASVSWEFCVSDQQCKTGDYCDRIYGYCMSCDFICKGEMRSEAICSQSCKGSKSSSEIIIPKPSALPYVSLSSSKPINTPSSTHRTTTDSQTDTPSRPFEFSFNQILIITILVVVLILVAVVPTLICLCNRHIKKKTWMKVSTSSAETQTAGQARTL